MNGNTSEGTLVQDDLRSICWAEECEQPLSQLEDAGPQGKQSDDQQFHRRQSEHIDGELAEPVAEGRWRSVLAGLVPLEATFLREEERHRMKDKIDYSDPCNVRDKL